MRKMVTFILCTMCLFFSACDFNKVLTENGLGCGSNNDFKNEENHDGSEYNSLYNTYKLTQESSMALVEILSIGDVLSYDPSVAANECIILECKVIEDYFCNLSMDEIINVPIMLPLLNEVTSDHIVQLTDTDFYGIDGKDDKQISGELLYEVLMSYKQVVVYISHITEIQRWYKNNSWSCPVYVNLVSNMIFLDYEFIPVVENVISLDSLKRFCSLNNCTYMDPTDTIANFATFVYEGMPFLEAKENILSLYQSQIKNFTN